MDKLSCWTGIERWDWKSNSLKKYQNVLRSGTVDYKDPGFPADDSSLFWEDFGEKIGVPRGMAWKRPKEMGEGWTDSPSLFGKGKQPVPNGIRQMGLADCWFLAGTSAVAEVPSRITDIMFDTYYNSAGLFRF